MASLDDLATIGNATNTILSMLVTAVQNAFPPGSNVSHSATAGTDALPANPASFLTVMVGGTAYKIPLYKP